LLYKEQDGNMDTEKRDLQIDEAFRYFYENGWSATEEIDDFALLIYVVAYNQGAADMAKELERG